MALQYYTWSINVDVYKQLRQRHGLLQYYTWSINVDVYKQQRQRHGLLQYYTWSIKRGCVHVM